MPIYLKVHYTKNIWQKNGYWKTYISGWKKYKLYYVNSSGVMFLNMKDCEKQEMLQSSSLCNSNWNSGEKKSEFKFPNLDLHT